MNQSNVHIEIYDKRERITSTVHVEKIFESTFRMVENDLAICRLTFGTEFETRINKDGMHEIVRITKKSDFNTRKFFLTAQFQTADYLVLGDEIMKQGGFWQVDLGSIATINLPKDSTLDLDEIFRTFDFHPCEIK